MGLNPTGCWNSLQPLGQFAWHWARQCTDTRAFILLNSQALEFRQWRSRADRVLTLDIKLHQPPTSTVLSGLGPCDRTGYSPLFCRILICKKIQYIEVKSSTFRKNTVKNAGFFPLQTVTKLHSSLFLRTSLCRNTHVPLPPALPGNCHHPCPARHPGPLRRSSPVPATKFFPGSEPFIFQDIPDFFLAWGKEGKIRYEFTAKGEN